MREEHIALQRITTFVGRTTNWLYDHYVHVDKYLPVFWCEQLANREEYPLLEARTLKMSSLSRRFWRRLAGKRLFPMDRLWLKRMAPRLIHSHFGDVGVGDIEMVRALGIPWLVSFYGADAFQLTRCAEWRDRYAILFERASRVLALGPFMAEKLKTVGCPEHKISVHPLGVEVDSIPSRPRQLRRGDTLKVLFAGTYREKKGIEYVLKGCGRALKSGIDLEIHLVGEDAGKVGDRETKEQVARTILELGLEDRVRHYPFLRFGELLDLAYRSHVFVAPSVTAADGDSEGTPFVLQQMMASGMACIATRHSDIPYLFGRHQSMLVEERDDGAIAERLVHYYESVEDIVKDGALLREQIANCFNNNESAKRLKYVYDSVCL